MKFSQDKVERESSNEKKVVALEVTIVESKVQNLGLKKFAILKIGLKKIFTGKE